MFSLVKKDLKLTAKMSLFLILFPIFISLAGLYEQTALIPVNIMYILSISMITYFSAMFSNGYDQKNKGEMVLNSLPISRLDIVKGKYLLLPTYTIVYFLVIFCLTNILILIGIGEEGRAANLADLIAVMNLILVFYSIYFPIYFKSENGLVAFNQIFYFIIILLPSMISRFWKALSQTKAVEKLIETNIENTNIILLATLIIIYLISLEISKKIYINKEF